VPEHHRFDVELDHIGATPRGERPGLALVHVLGGGTRTAVPRRRSTTSWSAVNGGQTTTSFCVGGDPRQQRVDELAASATVLFIFQLAAM